MNAVSDLRKMGLECGDTVKVRDEGRAELWIPDAHDRAYPPAEWDGHDGTDPDCKHPPEEMVMVRFETSKFWEPMHMSYIEPDKDEWTKEDWEDFYADDRINDGGYA